MKTAILVVGLVMPALLPAAGDPTVRAASAVHLAQAAPTCQNSQLLIRAQGGQGAAGTVAVIYRIHNVSAQPCSLFGYPGVQLLDRHFQSLPTTVHRGGSIVGTIPERRVTLGAYGNAYFTLAYSDVPVGNRPCQAPAWYLMIWAPNIFLPVVTYASNGAGGLMACTGNVYVSPVTARPTFH